MAGGKGGSTTSTVEVPQYIEDAARRNLERADLISQIGYVPYFGPDVAAFTPQQEAAFAGTQQLAGAFGTPTAANIGVPAPQTFAGGVRGYSSAPMFEQAQFELGRRRPAQKAFIDSLFIDPFSGAFNPISTTPLDMGEVVDTTTTTTPVTTTTTTGVGGGPTPVIADDFGNRGGVKVVNLGGTDFAIGGTALDLAGQPVDSLTDQELKYLADLGLAGTVDFGLNDGTTFVPFGDQPVFDEKGLDVSEQNALRSRINAIRNLENERNRQRASGYGAEAASTGQSVADLARAVEAERDQRFGVTRGGTATQYAGGGIGDFYDPRAGAFGQATATDIGEGSFTADLTRSLTDPNYNPEGTVLSRALGDISFGNIFGQPSQQAQNRYIQEVRQRQLASDNAAQRRESELVNLISGVGGQGLLDSGVELAGDQTMALERQFGTLTTSEVVDQANLEQKSIPLGKGGKDQTRKVLDKAAQEGNLGAYVDSFMDKYGGNLNQFQQDTGISNAVMKDIEKIAAAKGQ